MTAIVSRTLWLGLGVLAVAVTMACGGSDDNKDASATFNGQAVTCDTMNNDSYRFVTTVSFKVDAAPTPTPVGVAPGPGAVELTQKVEGQVEDANSYQADYAFIDQFNESHSTGIRKNDKYWLNTGTGWTEEDKGDIPYRAMSLCQSIAPDLDITAAHESEMVNGINSERFDFTDWATTWAHRAPDFGAGSDVGSLIQTYNGSVWVAHNGNYVSKMQLTGQGVYPDGEVLHIDISYEVKDRGSDVKIEAPVQS